MPFGAKRLGKDTTLKNITLHTQPSSRVPAWVSALVLYSALFIVTAPFNVARAQVAPSLGSAHWFTVLGGSTVTNTGPTQITGDLGASPGTAITGFPPGTTSRSVLHIADASANQAQVDIAAAYTVLGAEACTTTYSVPTDIGGTTLPPGVYCFSSSAQLTGVLTLDAGGDPNAVWVFEIGSTLITASGSSVQLANSAQQPNIFWQVGSSATLGTGSAFVGNILAFASITLNTNATLYGRALAQNGAVTLDDNVVSDCVCIQPYGPIVSTVIKTITVAPALGGVPGTVFGASLSPDGQSVWVAGYNGTSSPGFVSLIDVESLQVGKSATVGLGPADIAFTSTGGRAFVTNSYGSSLSVVSVPTLNVIQTIDLSGIPLSDPFGVVDVPGQLFVTTQGSVNQGNNNFVAALDTTTPPVVGTAISIPGQSGRPARVPISAAYHAGKVLVPVFVTGTGYDAGHPALVLVDTSNDTAGIRLTLWSSGATPEAVVVSPDGLYAYVSLFTSPVEAGGVWVVSLADLTTKTVILTCDPDNYGEAISKDGKYLLVAGFSEQQVALIDTATDTVDAIIKVGHGPNAIALTSDDSKAFVTNQADGTVMVVSFTPNL